MFVTRPTLCFAAQAAPKKKVPEFADYSLWRSVAEGEKKKETPQRKSAHTHEALIDIYHRAPPSRIMRPLTFGWKNEHLETSSAAVTAQGGRTRCTCGRGTVVVAVNAWRGASLGAPSLFPPSDVLTLLLVHVSGCGAIQLPELLSFKGNGRFSL